MCFKDTIIELHRLIALLLRSSANRTWHSGPIGSTGYVYKQKSRLFVPTVIMFFLYIALSGYRTIYTTVCTTIWKKSATPRLLNSTLTCTTSACSDSCPRAASSAVTYLFILLLILVVTTPFVHVLFMRDAHVCRLQYSRCVFPVWVRGCGGVE